MPDLVSFSQRYHYVTDALLIDTNGNILFSVNKNNDLGMNVFNGQFSQTLFSTAASKSLSTSDTVFSGIEYYQPSGGDISGFIFSPVTNDQARVIGVLAVKITLDIIFDLLENTQQKSLIHYLVDDNGLLLTSINDQRQEILTRKIKTIQIDLAMKQHIEEGAKPQAHVERAIEYVGPNGQNVYGVHHMLKIGDLHWYLVSEIDSEEAFSAIKHLNIITLSILLITAVLVMVLSIYLSNKITKPILTVGNGSEFNFELTFGKSEHSADVIPKIDISQLNLLIVDDNQTNREVLRGQLEHWGATVKEVGSAQQAIDLCRNYVASNTPLFDIAYLDMQMPDMDGARLGGILHNDETLKSIKLVMMTSMGIKAMQNILGV
jgi:CheY-like chemotaxis protein